MVHQKAFLAEGFVLQLLKGTKFLALLQDNRAIELFCTMHYAGFSAWDFPVSSPVLRLGVQFISRCFSMCLNSDSMVVAAALR